jgi:ribonuclease H / adenosylcobalamin/alpha-ribazole phosphatase
LQRGSATPEPPVRLTFGHGTNNAAEYLALIAGLRGLRAHIAQTGERPSDVILEVKGDSMLVIEQMSGRWKVKDSGLRSLWEEAQNLVQGWGDVRFVRQPRRRSVALLGH